LGVAKRIAEQGQRIAELLGTQFQTHLSAGGLIAAWQRLAEVFQPWYVEIAEQVRASAVLHADEGGGRVGRADERVPDLGASRP
jgi:hypothetical protein